jgi:hypothetical protein
MNKRKFFSEIQKACGRSTFPNLFAMRQFTCTYRMLLYLPPASPFKKYVFFQHNVFMRLRMILTIRGVYFRKHDLLLGFVIDRRCVPHEVC